MKKLIISAVVLTTSLGLTGCGGGGSSSVSSTSTSTAPTLSAADQALQNAGIPKVYWKQLEQIHADYAFSQKDSGAGVSLVFSDQADLGKSMASELVNQPYSVGSTDFLPTVDRPRIWYTTRTYLRCLPVAIWALRHKRSFIMARQFTWTVATPITFQT